MVKPRPADAPLPIIRTSERKDFQRCPQRWQWGWRYGLRRPGHTANALWFGTGWHLVMAHWYCGPGKRRGRSPLKVWRDYVGEELAYVKTVPPSDNVDDEPVWVEARALGEAMLGAYLDRYGKDEAWHVIAPEQSVQVTVPNAVGGPMAIYAATFDLVYRDLDEDGEPLKLGEHKTAKIIQTGHLPLDPQGGSYWAIATDSLRARGVLKPSEALVGITYNFARKAMPDDRPKDDEGFATNKPRKEDYLAALRLAGYDGPDIAKGSLAYLQAVADKAGVRVLGPRSERQPSPLLLREFVYRSRGQRRGQLRRIQDEARVMQAMRSGLLPVIKNTTQHCQFDCSFFDMCQLHEAGGDWQTFRDAMFVKRDPYADHRKSAAE